MAVPEGPRWTSARVTFTPKRAERSLHGEGCLPDVQTSLCTSAICSGVNLYTYIGPMVRRCSKWQVLVMVPFRSSADLRFGVLEPRSRRGWGAVYLLPTPLRRGGGHRRAPESSEGKWAFFGSTCTSRAYNNCLGIRIGYTFEFVVHGLPLVLISYENIFVKNFCCV